jgi:hypothetical protein
MTTFIAFLLPRPDNPGAVGFLPGGEAISVASAAVAVSRTLG